MKNKYKCPTCKSSNTVRRGKRNGKLRFFCKDCSSWFQINRGKKSYDVDILISHLDGTSFRKLSDQYSLSVGNVYNKAYSIASNLPHCADITREYCNRYSGILLCDGKYVKVKGYDRKIPFIYGIDYTTHDIPTYKLVRSESYLAWLKFFESLKLMNYPLRMLVSDDNENIRLACNYVYPNAHFQLCHNHYKENIRRILQVRSNEIHKEFMSRINELFSFKRSLDDFNRYSKNILNDFNHNQIYVSILVDIYKRRNVLLGYLNVKGTPNTNNLIESFNSHFESRLRAMRGFDSFKHADLWINALIVRRRFKDFTDCKRKFKHLNGKSSIQKTKNKNVVIPTLSKLLGDQK